MIGTILEFEDLQRLFRYERLSDLEQCLTRNRIPFARGKRGVIWTTLDAVNAGLGVASAPPADGSYKPDDVFPP